MYNIRGIHFKYKNLVMKFKVDGKEYTLQGIKDYFSQVSSNILEGVLEDKHLGRVYLTLALEKDVWWK